MVSGFTTGGVDLDDVFEPYNAGTKPAATGHTTAGQDFADRFQPVGVVTPGADVGYTTAGVDLAKIFAPLGSGGGVDTSPAWNGMSRTNFSYDLGENAARLRLAVGSDGDLGIWTSDFEGGLWSQAVKQNDSSWYLPETASVGAGYQVRFTPTAIIAGGDIVNEASAWAVLTTGRDFTLTLTQSTTGNSECKYNVLVEIRETGGAVLASGTVTLHALAEIS